MKIHKEGYKIIAYTVLISILLLLIIKTYVSHTNWLILLGGFMLFDFFIIRFFRIPKRKLLRLDNKVTSSADGIIVAIEKVFETNILKTQCIQVSTFMKIGRASCRERV